MKKNILSTIALALSIGCMAQSNDKDGYYKGDINGDQKVDILDLSLLINVLNGKTTANNASKVNDDDIIDINDVNALKEIVLGTKEKTWVSNSLTIKVDNTPINASDGE